MARSTYLIDQALRAIQEEDLDPNKIFVKSLDDSHGVSAGYWLDDDGQKRFVLTIDQFDLTVSALKVENLEFKVLENVYVSNAGVTHLVPGISVISLPIDLREPFRWIASSVFDAYCLDRDLRTIYEILRAYAEALTRRPIVSETELAGYWGELLIIASSTETDACMRAWRVNESDGEDFWFQGLGSIEVKLNSLGFRRHFFSSKQISSNSEMSKVVASIVTRKTGTGTSLIELLESIQFKSRSPSALANFELRLIKEIGFLYMYEETTRFDRELAMRKLIFLSSLCIPRIDVHEPILWARWEADLSDVSNDLSEGETNFVVNLGFVL
jgi:hypothetical protein